MLLVFISNRGELAESPELLYNARNYNKNEIFEMFFFFCLILFTVVRVKAKWRLTLIFSRGSALRNAMHDIETVQQNFTIRSQYIFVFADSLIRFQCSRHDG